MRLFLFNEILPDLTINNNYTVALVNTLQEYKKLKQKFPDCIEGIVTSSFPENIQLSKNINLFQCLESIKNKDLRSYSFSLFQRYPIDVYTNVEKVLDEGNEYHLLMDGIEVDALNIKLFSNENRFLFSLNLHSVLSKNTLSILSPSQSSINISNLYGDLENTDFIENLIKTEEQSKLDNFEKLKYILTKYSFSTKFENEFNKVSKQIQDLILEGFKTIIHNKTNDINTPETLLKDVTPDREKTITIKELKLRNPIAKRIYFSIIDDEYYVASLENKPLKDGRTTEQSNHIKSALSCIKQLVKLK